jgi:class 3 adenylate cyclase
VAARIDQKHRRTKKTNTRRMDPTRGNIRRRVEQARPVQGYCLMIDLVESTKLKDRPAKDWMTDLTFTFYYLKDQIVEAHSDAKHLKIVGDMLMFWLPAPVPNLPVPNIVSLFQTLIELLDESPRPPNGYLPFKIALVQCVEAYEINFFDDRNDIYGKEIDLTARLLNLASDGEFLFNDLVQESLRARMALDGSKAYHQSWFSAIQGPWAQQVKGFANPVQIYKYRRASGT